MTRIIVAFLLAGLSLVALTPRRGADGAVLGSLVARWLREVRRSRGLRWTVLTRRRESAATGDTSPAPVVAPVRRIRVRKARFGDGVVGFVCGLILVTVVLAAALAFAAQSLR